MRSYWYFLVFGLALLPTTAGAVETIPEFNPICWQKEQCQDVRAQLINREAKKFSDLKNPDEIKQAMDGFRENEAPCQGNNWGKCLPASIVNTQIAFGGKRQFLHIGDFLQYNYTYAITIAGILAVIMIIISGAQWVASGGNSEAITSAKSRIGNAVIGLFIAYGSFFILNTINPRLVNLQIPNVWMVRPSEIVPKFCVDAPSVTLFHAVAGAKSQTSTIDFSAAFEYESTYAQIATDKFACGNRFAMKGGGQATCFGAVCPGNSKCINVNIESGELAGKYYCGAANVYGRITYPLSELLPTGCGAGVIGRGVNGWQTPKITDGGAPEVWILCKDGSGSKMAVEDTRTFTFPDYQFYHSSFPGYAVDQMVNTCGGMATTKGFVIRFEMNGDCTASDDVHWFGYDGGTNLIDLGEAKFFGQPGALTADGRFINDKYFIPPAKLKQGGLQLDMDASEVHYIYGDTSKISVYNYLTH